MAAFKSFPVRAGKYPKDHPREGEPIQFRVRVMTEDARWFDECKAALQRMRDALVAAGRSLDAEYFMRQAGEAAGDPDRFRVALEAALIDVPALPEATAGYRSWGELALAYCDGTLRRDHPSADLPDKATSDRDDGRRKWLDKFIGKVPLDAFTRKDYDHALKNLPPTSVEPASHRQYGQLVLRVMRVGRELGYVKAWHLDGVEAPKVPRANTKKYTCCYPNEFYRLLGKLTIAFERRSLWGFMCLESPRIGKLRHVRWRHVHRRGNGGISIESKNGDLLEWTFRPGTLEALDEVKRLYPSLEGPFSWMTASFVNKAAKHFRADMLEAGNDRDWIHESEGRRKALRAHDCRATFIVNSLREGRNEKWIMTRTGHTTSAMVHKYDRLLEAAVEEGWAPLGRLDEALGLKVEGGSPGPTPAPGASRDGVASEPATAEAAPGGVTVGVTVASPSPVTPPGVDRESSHIDAGSPSGGRTRTPKGRGILSATIAPPSSQNPEQPGGCDTPEGPGSDPLSHPPVTARMGYALALKAAMHAAIEADAPPPDVPALRALYDVAAKAAGGATVVDLAARRGVRS